LRRALFPFGLGAACWCGTCSLEGSPFYEAISARKKGEFLIRSRTFSLHSIDAEKVPQLYWLGFRANALFMNDLGRPIASVYSEKRGESVFGR